MCKISNITPVLILVIVIIALTLRLPGISRILISSDEATILLASLDPFSWGSPLSVQTLGRGLLRFFSFPWGYGILVVNFLNALLWSLAGIRLNEAVLRIPVLLLGVGSGYLLYAIGRQLYSAKAGLVAAALLAVLPVHIEYSKGVHCTIIVSSFFLLAAVASLLKYFSSGRRSWGIVASGCIGMYMVSDNQFLFSLPVWLAVGFFSSEGGLRLRLTTTLRRFWSGRLWIIPLLCFLPLLFSWGYFASKGHPTYGFLGHLLDKEKSFGLHYQIIAYVLRNCGVVLTTLLVLAIGVALRQCLRLKSDGLLFIWSASYLSIWLFLAKPLAYAQGNRAYYLLWILPLLIVTGELLVRYLPTRLLWWVLGGVLIATFSISLRQPTLVEEVFINEIDASQRYTNYGAKTAGYYLRQHTAAGEPVAGDIGATVLRYYSHRRVIHEPALFWTITGSSDEEKYRYLSAQLDQINLLVVRQKNLGRAQSMCGNELARIVEIRSCGRPVLHIFSRRRQPPEVWDTERYDRLFDAAYGQPKTLALGDYVDAFSL